MSRCRECRGRKKKKDGTWCEGCLGTGEYMTNEQLAQARELELKREEWRRIIREGLMRGG
jgi:hypothetical protein